MPFQPGWKKVFIREKAKLKRILAGLVSDLQHVGSTSIPGMEAKPIIDIAISVPTLRKIGKCKKLLEANGYLYKGDEAKRGDHLFVKGPEARRTIFLHMVRHYSRNWQNYVLFRNHLMKHGVAFRQYLDLKRDLARKYKDRREAYTKGKSSFIQKILKEARSSFVKHPLMVNKEG